MQQCRCPVSTRSGPIWTVSLKSDFKVKYKSKFLVQGQSTATQAVVDYMNVLRQYCRVLASRMTLAIPESNSDAQEMFSSPGRKANP